MRCRFASNDARVCAGQLVLSATEQGTLSDRKWALEVVGIVPEPILLRLLQKAFASPSQWLKEVAYRQAARLDKIPSDIANGIRLALVNLETSGRLASERHATYAHLTRLDKSTDFVSVMQLLRLSSVVDIMLHFLLFVLLLSSLVQADSVSPQRVIGLVVTILISRLGVQGLLAATGSWTGAIWLRVLLITILWASFSGIMPWLLTLAISSVTMLWLPTAIFSARTGWMTHPLWWPILPVAPIIYFVNNIRELVPAAIARLRGELGLFIVITPALIAVVVMEVLRSSNNASAVLGSLSISAVVGEIIILPLYIAVRQSEMWRELARSRQVTLAAMLSIAYAAIIGAGTFLIDESIMAAAFLLGLLAWFAGILLTMLRWIRGWARWHRWTQRHTASMTVQEFLRSISDHQIKMLVIRHVRYVREQGLLIATEGTETLLQRLSLQLERSSTSLSERTSGFERRLMRLIAAIGRSRRIIAADQQSAEPSSQQAVGTSFDPGFYEEWLADYTRKDQRRLSKLNPELLDEICKLLEQVRTSRRD